MSSEADKFDKVVRTLLSVSHDEIKRREEEWKHQRGPYKAGRKRAKTSPASRASTSKA